MSMTLSPVTAATVAAAQKKKGIKSSLGRFFSKKEKVFNHNILCHSKTLSYESNIFLSFYR